MSFNELHIRNHTYSCLRLFTLKRSNHSISCYSRNKLKYFVTIRRRNLELGLRKYQQRRKLSELSKTSYKDHDNTGKRSTSLLPRLTIRLTNISVSI